MLDEMGDAVALGLFVTAAGQRPESGAGALHVRHLRRGNDDAILQAGDFIA